MAMATVPGRIRVAWRAAKESLGTGAVRWAMVSGPIGALIAQLSEYGWKLTDVDTWVAPGGESMFTLDPRSPVASFVRWVCEQARMVPWDRAAAHYLGRGLERGPGQSSYKVLKSLRKEGKHPEAGAL